MNILRPVTGAAAWSKERANRLKNRNRSKSRKNFMGVFSPQHPGPQVARDVKFPTVFMLYLRHLLAGFSQSHLPYLLPIFFIGAVLSVNAQAQQPETIEKKVENPIGA